MELHAGSKRKAVGELLSQLLSRDAVVFNSAINSSFSSSVVYSGHGLKIQGASNLKHAAWLMNAVVGGREASFEMKDIQWNEKDNSAIVQTVRYVRPRFFPIVGFAIPVKTQLRFHADGDGPSSSKGDSQPQLYVTSFEDHWPLDTFIKSLPVLGWLYQALFTPIATLLVLALSNITFAGYASATSSKRHYIDSSVDALSVRAKKALPKEMSSNVNSGFQEGTKIAQGWGTRAIGTAEKIVYPLLSTIEHLSQQGTSLSNRVLPVSLPYPYIYDAHSHPSGGAVKLFSEGNKNLPAPVAANSKPDAPASAPPASAASSQSQQKSEEVHAMVQVKPSMDGSDQGKTVEIKERNNNESEDKPAPSVIKAEGSLYDQLRKEGELPTTQEKLDTLAVPSQTAGPGSSEEDEHGSHSSNGGSKKKKSGSKKKKGGVSHTHPPSFKEGLHQAEEAQAQQHHA